MNGSDFWEDLVFHQKMVQGVSDDGGETLRYIKHPGDKYKCQECCQRGEVEDFDNELSVKGLIAGFSLLLVLLVVVGAIATNT